MKMKKALSVLLSITTVATLFVTPVSAAESNTSLLKDSKNIKVIEIENNNSSNHLKYIMTDKEQQKYLVDENIISNNDVVTCNSNIVLLDEQGNPIESTRETDVLTGNCKTKKITEKVNKDGKVVSTQYTLKDENNKSDLITTDRYSGSWKSYSHTYSLKRCKFTIGKTAAMLAIVIGASTGGTTAIATGIINLCIQTGVNEIPDSIYFSGKRKVNRSSGKIYYRYKGKFYSDSSMSHCYGSLSWSKRWGH